MKGLFRSLIAAVALGWTASRWLLGYIDPNTGGMLFQILAVAFALSSGLVLFFSRQIRVGVARISRVVRGLFSH